MTNNIVLQIPFIIQEKDLAVAGLTITSQRSGVVDFTYPFWFEPNVAAVKVSKNPNTVAFDWKLFECFRL